MFAGKFNELKIKQIEDDKTITCEFLIKEFSNSLECEILNGKCIVSYHIKMIKFLRNEQDILY